MQIKNSNNKILILGDIFLDIFQTTNVIKISPERPVPVLQPKKSINLLGGAGNVSNNIKSIGGSVFLISKLSNDATSKIIRKLLKKNKINYKIFFNKDYSSPVKKRVVHNDHQFCRLDDEFYSKLKKNDEIKIFNFIKKNIYNFNSLIISDYAKGCITQSLLTKVIKIFRKKKKKIFVDPKSNNIEIYKNSNFICPNLIEFKNFFEYHKLSKTKISSLKLLKKINADAFIITKGSNGISIIFKNNKTTDISQRSVNVYDVTGAGDTFIAIITYLYSMQIDLINSVKIASLACIKIVQKKHTSILKFTEFQKIINEYCYNNKVNLDLKIKLWKLAKFKLGITNGCFDVIHSGHLHLFNKAKGQCDKLIVLINSDNSVKKLKGKNRPILKLDKRIELIKIIKSVDEIVPFNENTPLKLIDKILPDILFKGSDYIKKNVVGYHLIENNGGKVQIIQKLKDFSTTNLVNQ